MKDIELFNDHFQNYKVYGIPKAQLVIADIPYNIGKDAYGSNPMWYKDGDFFSANNLPIYTLRITDVKYLDILFRVQFKMVGICILSDCHEFRLWI